MNSIRKVSSNEEHRLLGDRLKSCFRSSSLAEHASIFTCPLKNFLLFDEQYITEPKLMNEFLRIGERDYYIGSLINFPVAPYETPSYYVSREATLADVTEAFNASLNAADGPIQLFVDSGFVIPIADAWVIWFSAYWEVAIAAFASLGDAEMFRARHSRIPFKGRDAILERYAMNPASKASVMLAYYMDRNSADQAGSKGN